MIKRMSILLGICFALYVGTSNFLLAQSAQTPRKTTNFNREWRYFQGDDPNAGQTTFSDRDWATVGLPHSFSIPYFMSKDFYVGVGWYRKQFNLEEADLVKLCFIEFDGVFQETEVFVNGERVGSHVGGYTGFSVNISPYVKAGTNLIAVRVNNIWKPDLAPRAGEHVFSGGIYRNVRFVQKSPVYIDWYGTFVTTPDLARHKGQSSAVNVQTDVYNRMGQSADYRLKTEIVDMNGKTITSVESIENVGASTMRQFQQTTTPVMQPTLWHPQHPVLYKVVSSLYRDDTLLDRDETTFGFRWFEWTADRGFFLNGQHLYLKGANVHQDHAGWGDAVTESAMRRDVRQMKEAGFDFIRGSHYPHSPAFSRACDEEGMLFWSEALFWGIGGFKPDGYWDSSAYPVDEKDREGFESSALRQLGEMIRIHRNHPSIVAWSMCNEPFFSAPETMPGVTRLLKKMVSLSRQLDPTRPAAVGGVQRPLGQGRLDVIGDVAGYNGDGSNIPEFQNPGIPSLVSEYGSTTADRPGNYEPGWGDLGRDDGWKGFPWRSGQAIWCGFDHGSIAGSQLGKMGIVDYFRLPKRVWYWYRNEYRQIAPPRWAEEGIPQRIRLEASRTKGVRADGTEDVQLTLHILDAQGQEISNTPPVDLKLISGPGEFPTGTSIRFEKESDIRILDGKAAIEFRSYYAGVSVIEATSPGLESARIEIQFTDAPDYVEGRTPVVKERPYVRYVREQTEEIVQTFGRNNPTFSSSSVSGQPAGYAADGDEGTCWQADSDDQDLFWTLDTEKGLALREVKLLFPKEACYQYKVETSADNLHWDVLVDRTEAPKRRKTDLIPVVRKDKARFVRIRFVRGSSESASPSLSEVVVKGVVLD